MIISKTYSLLKRVKLSFESLFLPQNNFSYSTKLYSHHNISFSQEGEDMILEGIFKRKKDGFYVDVGAHHPQKFSNTYKFYLRGWHGINIDAMPDSMQSFCLTRNRDINLEIPISDTKSQLTYFLFDEPALNTFSPKLAEERNNSDKYSIIDKQKLETATLANILDKYLPKNQKIDFLSIDVEGLDYQVLMSNNWDKYRPHIILVEDLQDENMPRENDSRIHFFLIDKGYHLCARTLRTAFFRENDD